MYIESNTNNKIYEKINGLSLLVNKISIRLGIFLILIFLITSISLFMAFKLELTETKKKINMGIETVKEEINTLYKEVESGKGNTISLKEDAFSVIDETEIILEDGLNDFEIEQALDNHKYGRNATLDGNTSNDKDIAGKFNHMWGIEEGVEFDSDFRDRLGKTHKEHIWQVDWQYFNQRSIPVIGNVICVPSSATYLVNALGYDINVKEILDYFSKSEKIKIYAETHFGKWVEPYINNNKLYQITGIFTYGLNHYLNEIYPDFPYELDYGYWSIDEIAEYVDSFGLMSATYLPHWVLHKRRSGGHMVAITKVYRDFEGNIIGFGLNDPFGNPNVAYRGARGWDGKNVVLSLDDMLTVMKSYRDDHKHGTNRLYRVLYFRDKG